jgi:hypothetical protein
MCRISRVEAQGLTIRFGVCVMTPRQSDLQRHGLRRVIANALAMTKGGDPHEIATNRWIRFFTWAGNAPKTTASRFAPGGTFQALASL